VSVEFRGEEFLYLVEVDDDGSSSNFRLFNQTGGSTTSDAEAIELATKDKSGSDYGDVSQSISIEGILTEGDTAIDFIRKAQRQKRFVKIIEVNTRTLDTEEGMYMISSFGRTFANGDHATYTIDGSLSGSITEGTLTELPDGAPDSASETEGAEG